MGVLIMRICENGKIIDMEIVIDETMITDIEFSEPTEKERTEALESTAV